MNDPDGTQAPKTRGKSPQRGLRPLRRAGTFLPSLTHVLRLSPLLLLLSASAPFIATQTYAQGMLTVTPGRTAATSAGTGTPGFSGDGSTSTLAQLARPSGIAYDSAGDLFVADANNHVIREITPGGTIITVAGTGIAGFGGDGGPATAALLDTPASVTIDADRTLYIADSHNHRIRKVTQGTMSTVAGTGTSGFSGDGGPALSAQFALPSALALDASGNLYIADTNNHRVRKITGGAISTVAGNGEELFAGDGGAATAASLDQPTGLALDGAGNLYIADKNNHRVRVVSSAGIISTLAGSGGSDLAGSFGGDGGTATSASLAKPVGLSVDGSGNVYVADTNNQRIRQISAGGVITTAVGTGDQGFGGDGGVATGAILNSPRGMGTDSTGNLLLADTHNERLRAATQGQISFGTQALGTTFAPQTIMLSNTGKGSLTVTSSIANGPFAVVDGGTCAAIPITLAAGASCTTEVAYQPVESGNALGWLTFSGAAVNTQRVLLAGSAAARGITQLTLTESKTASLSGESVTFTAALSAAAPGAQPAGTVTFYGGSTALGTSPLVNGVASLSSSLPDGMQTVTAAYSGDAGFAGSSSAAVAENVADYTLSLGALATPTVEPGHTVAVPVTLAADGVTGLTAVVQLQAGTLPPGISNVTFSPATASLVDGLIPFTMNVTAAPAGQASVHGISGFGGGGAVLALLLLPSLGRRQGERLRGVRLLLLVLAFVGGGAASAGLTGCGGSTGFLGQPQKSYTVDLAATATDSTGGSLTRTTSIVINVP